MSSSVREQSTTTQEGVYIECTGSREDGGDTHRMPTTLPIPAETIELLDLDTAVLVGCP